MWHLFSSVRSLVSLDQCIKNSVLSAWCHTPALSFLFLLSSPLLFFLPPQPSDILYCIWGASIDQSLPGSNNVLHAILTVTNRVFHWQKQVSVLHFQQHIRLDSRVAFDFTRKLSSTFPQFFRRKGRGEKGSVWLKEKTEQLFWNLGEI